MRTGVRNGPFSSCWCNTDATVIRVGHDTAVFWPDEADLRQCDWWDDPAWADGPTYGDLVYAVQPVLRAASLSGYQIISINIGEGPGVVAQGGWQRIDLGTLELAPGEWDSPNLGSDVGIWFDIVEIADLIDGEIDGYGTGVMPPVIDAIAADQNMVPREIFDAVDVYVDDAINELVALLADETYAPRGTGRGLMWIFDATWWHPKPDELLDVCTQVSEQLMLEPEAFLRGQIYASRERHDASQTPGPANLYFLLSRKGVPVKDMHSDFWFGLLWELQVSGGARSKSVV